MPSLESPAVDAMLAPASALVLALVHLLAGRFRFGDRIPRSRWLSLAGGVSIAYVFVHLLPEIRDAAATLERYGSPTAFAEQYGYVIALLGFVAFYGLERFARRARTGAGDRRRDGGAGAFWIHVCSFAVYNGIIGYLLWDRELGALVPFVVAMALHFVVTDAGLRDHHGLPYHRRGRWLLAAAILAGSAIGYVFEGAFLVAVFVPFLSGGIILNVIKEELPSDRRSRFWAFAGGAAGYAALLLFV